MWLKSKIPPCSAAMPTSFICSLTTHKPILENVKFPTVDHPFSLLHLCIISSAEQVSEQNLVVHHWVLGLVEIPCQSPGKTLDDAVVVRLMKTVSVYEQSDCTEVLNCQVNRELEKVTFAAKTNLYEQFLVLGPSGYPAQKKKLQV